MPQPVLIALFGLAFGAFSLTMLSLVEDRSVRIAARVVVVVAMGACAPRPPVSAMLTSGPG